MLGGWALLGCVVVLLCTNAEDTTPFNCEGRRDGHYLKNAKSCTDIFWRCWQGKPYKFTCPHNLFYRIEAERCDHRDKVPNCDEAKKNKEDGDRVVLLEEYCGQKKDGYYKKQIKFQCVANSLEKIVKFY